MIIEVHTFKLAEGADESAFLKADERVQHELIPFLDGFMRRTTARGTDGTWLVETLWDSMEDAEVAETEGASDGAAAAFAAFVDPDTASCRRFQALD